MFSRSLNARTHPEEVARAGKSKKLKRKMILFFDLNFFATGFYAWISKYEVILILVLKTIKGNISAASTHFL